MLAVPLSAILLGQMRLLAELAEQVCQMAKHLKYKTNKMLGQTQGGEEMDLPVVELQSLFIFVGAKVGRGSQPSK